ncbi:MAG: hypothetical protein AAFP19_04665 [Bacteroidota bacterium]
MNTKQILSIVAIILALLLLLSGWWGYRLSGENMTLKQENNSLNTDLQDLHQLKADLQEEVDSLSLAYEVLALENDSLESSLDEAKSTINRRDRSIRALKVSSKEKDQQLGEMSSLRSQIQQLLTDKSQLENSILSLQSENDSLRMRTGVLEKDLGIAREESKSLAKLNESMQNDLDRLTLANFKASAFRVEVEKKRPKATAKSRRARRVQVSFDLTNVPEEYQGVRPVYLVIADEQGTPIKLKNPIKANVSLNGQATDIIAAEARDVDITENQRLSFQHNLAEKLKRGYYRVMVYTDIGLLGASSIRLR